MPLAPADTRTELAPHLRLAVMRLARRLRQQTAAEDLTPSQSSALSVIEALGPISLGELAAVEQVQPPTMTRVVAHLEERGLVVRAADPADRRSARVTVTATGRRVLQRSRTRRTAYLAQRLAGFTDEERGLLTRALPLLERLTEEGR